MWLMETTGVILQWLALAFVFVIGLSALFTVVLFFIDRSQTGDAVRRNYPVIGRFRHIFTELGEFFRQYFFAMDREELPFNRAQRDWVKRATSGRGNTVAFGSTRDLSVVGTPLFVNSPFPPLEDGPFEPEPMMIGEATRNPYQAKSFFNLSGMSYGAISRPAVLALSKGCREAGVWMNTGEGGLSPYHLEGGADLIFQIGTAKYGVRDQDGKLDPEKLRQIAEHDQVKMFEIKLAQGAKPGKGGILPAPKITPEIAEIRGIKQGKDSLSPNRHPEVATFEELLDFIQTVREISGKPTGVKLVYGSNAPMRSFFETIEKRGEDSAPDFITLDGGEGGTGASPLPLMDLVGVSVREALPVVSDLLTEFGLRDRVRLVASGKLMVPGDVAWALAAGADFVVSARGFMFALGCIQAMKCNKNTCPTGITTHDPRFQKGLVPEDKYKKVAIYAKSMVKEVGTIAHSVGVSQPRQLDRHHVRIMQENGRSVLMSDLYSATNPTNS